MAACNRLGLVPEITGYFSIHPLTKACMVLVLSLALMFSAVGWITAVTFLLGESRDVNWVVPVALGAMALMPLAAVFARVVEQKERGYVSGVLQRDLWCVSGRAEGLGMRKKPNYRAALSASRAICLRIWRPRPGANGRGRSV